MRSLCSDMRKGLAPWRPTGMRVIGSSSKGCSCSASSFDVGGPRAAPLPFFGAGFDGLVKRVGTEPGHPVDDDIGGATQR